MFVIIKMCTHKAIKIKRVKINKVKIKRNDNQTETIDTIKDISLKQVKTNV